MASSNRHWPSMFKSKPTYTNHQLPDHQWHAPNHHLLSSSSSATLKSSSSSYTSGNDERTPEPKPRWNPKPEQIRILESIFNSGLVNPPRDEIRRIRARLQEYGQVGDANVFYWFQNRKSRSKHKNRQLAKSQTNQTHQSSHAAATKAVAITTSSSSSSDKSSSKSIEFFLNSPTVSVNQPQTFYGGGQQHHHGEFFQEPYFFPVGQQQQQQAPPAPSPTSFSQGFCFSELGTMISRDNHLENNDQTTVVSSSEMLLTDLMINHQYGNPSKNSKNKEIEEESIMKMFTPSTSFTLPPPPPQPLAIPTTTIAPTINVIQGVEEAGTGKSIVFINDMPFEVAVGPFNVKEAFGGDAVLIDSSGQTVVTNEWGVTLQSLQHGAFYYLVRPFTYDHAAAGTVDLI